MKKLIKKYYIYIIISFIAIAIRCVNFPFESSDYTQYLKSWNDSIIESGKILSLKYNIGNYTTTYMYIMIALSYLPIKMLYGIKIVSCIFDFACAVTVVKIIGLKYESDFLKKIGYALSLLLPTTILNGAVWGQCDSIYTSFLLIAIYYLLKEDYIKVVIFFAIAFCIKLQAIFFAPIILIFLIKKKIKFRYLFLIPTIYFISILPSVIAGRNIIDIFRIYFDQTNTYGEYFLDYKVQAFFKLFLNIKNLMSVNEIIVTFCIIAIIYICYLIYIVIKKKSYSKLDIIYITILSVMGTVFLLPEMHERYYYFVEIILIIAAIYSRKKVDYIIIGIFQITTVINYSNYLFKVEINNIIIVLTSCIALLILIYYFYCYIYNKEEKKDNFNNKEEVKLKM